jgi:DnaK suppressor protein
MFGWTKRSVSWSRTKGIITMEKTKLKKIKVALEERRGVLLSDLQRLDQEMQWLGDDQGNERGGLGNHLGDDGSSVMEQERISTVSADLHEVLQQVNAALERMDQGTYGVCQRCGKPINPERLEAFPYVTYCIDCQTFLERQHSLRG